MSGEEAHNIYNMVGLRTGCCQITELVEKYEQLQQENKELKEKIEALKELDLYECESDYDYEENLELNYVPFSIEEFLEGDK